MENPPPALLGQIDHFTILNMPREIDQMASPSFHIFCIILRFPAKMDKARFVPMLFNFLTFHPPIPHLP